MTNFASPPVLYLPFKPRARCRNSHSGNARRRFSCTGGTPHRRDAEYAEQTKKSACSSRLKTSGAAAKGLVNFCSIGLAEVMPDGETYVFPASYNTAPMHKQNQGRILSAARSGGP